MVIKASKERLRDSLTGRAEGFTLIELIVVILIIGVLSTITVPIFHKALLKAKQKEASMIVSSYIKAAKSYYAEHGQLPRHTGQLGQYVSVVGCFTFGAKWCQADKPSGKHPSLTINWDGTDVNYPGLTTSQFFSISGNYVILFSSYGPGGKLGYNDKWKIVATPVDSSGGHFQLNGYEVRGCWNPKEQITKIWQTNENPFTGFNFSNYPGADTIARKRIRETNC